MNSGGGWNKDGGIDTLDGTCSGNGLYRFSMLLKSRIQNLIPMFGQKVTISLTRRYSDIEKSIQVPQERC